eukprot:jgi/Mesvir1/16344/Mv18093-RA.1
MRTCGTQNRWLYDPETGEMVKKTYKNEESIEKWKAANPDKTPASPKARCHRCKGLVPVSSFRLNGVFFEGIARNCAPCRKEMTSAVKDAAAVHEERARVAALKLHGDEKADCSFTPSVGRGNEEFEMAAFICTKTGGFLENGAGVLESYSTCQVCNETLTNVYSCKTPNPHFHIGGVCISCVWDFLESADPDWPVLCPICTELGMDTDEENDERHPELSFPYFEFDTQLTVLAFMAGSDTLPDSVDDEPEPEPTYEEDEHVAADDKIDDNQHSEVGKRDGNGEDEQASKRQKTDNDVIVLDSDDDADQAS